MLSYRQLLRQHSDSTPTDSDSSDSSDSQGSMPDKLRNIRNAAVALISGQLAASHSTHALAGQQARRA